VNLTEVVHNPVQWQAVVLAVVNLQIFNSSFVCLQNVNQTFDLLKVLLNLYGCSCCQAAMQAVGKVLSDTINANSDI